MRLDTAPHRTRKTVANTAPSTAAARRLRWTSDMTVLSVSRSCVDDLVSVKVLGWTRVSVVNRERRAEAAAVITADLHRRPRRRGAVVKRTLESYAQAITDVAAPLTIAARHTDVRRCCLRSVVECPRRLCLVACWRCREATVAVPRDLGSTPVAHLKADRGRARARLAMM